MSVNKDDFYFDLPNGCFVFIPTGQRWATGSLNRIKGVHPETKNLDGQ